MKMEHLTEPDRWWGLKSDKGLLCFKYFKNYHYLRLTSMEIASIFSMETKNMDVVTFIKTEKIKIIIEELGAEKKVLEQTLRSFRKFHGEYVISFPAFTEVNSKILAVIENIDESIKLKQKSLEKKLKPKS